MLFTYLHKNTNPTVPILKETPPLLFFPAHGKIIACPRKNKSMGRYIIICNNVIQHTIAGYIQTFYHLLHTLAIFITFLTHLLNKSQVLFYISLQNLMIQCKNILLRNFTRISRSTKRQ